MRYLPREDPRRRRAEAVHAAGAQKRRAFCASRPDLGLELLPRMDAHVAIETRRVVLAGRSTDPHRHVSSPAETPTRVGSGPGLPLVRVPSDGSRSFELYEEEQNAWHVWVLGRAARRARRPLPPHGSRATVRGVGEGVGVAVPLAWHCRGKPVANLAACRYDERST